LKLFEFHSKFESGRGTVTSLHGFHKVQLYLGNWDAMNSCMGLAWTGRRFTYCTLFI